MKKALQLFIIEFFVLTFATYRTTDNWVLFSAVNIAFFVGYAYLLYTWEKKVSLNPYTNLMYLWIKLLVLSLCLIASSEGMIYLILSYITILSINYIFRNHFKS